jgi:hypothetical protein
LLRSRRFRGGWEGVYGESAGARTQDQRLKRLPKYQTSSYGQLQEWCEDFKKMILVIAVGFNIVHFNNGMHGWSYTETQYREAFPAFL